MINIYVYPFFVLVSFFLIYIGVIKTMKFAGYKIKICSLLIFFSLLCRYISLIILMTSRNIIYLYILKPFFYMNYLSVPILSMVTIYIIMRNEKFKFENIFVVALIFIVLYFFLLSLVPGLIEFSNFYGYSMYLQSPLYFYLFKVFMNILFLIFTITLLNKNQLDKKGIYLIIIAAVMAIVEIVLTMLNLRVFQENILSDFFWVIAFIYALSQLEKSTK